MTTALAAAKSDARDSRRRRRGPFRVGQALRRTRRSDIDGLFALLAAGCGSSEPITGDTNAAPRSLAVGDLRPLVTISPGVTGWPWPVNPQTRVASPPFELDESDPSYPIQKALSDVYQDAGLVKSATSSWFDGTKKASSFANLVATPAEATSAEAEREFARAWFPEFEHTKRFATSERRASVSVAVRGGTDNAGFVEIGWRTATPSSPSTSPATRATPTSQMPPAAGPTRSTMRHRAAR